MKNLTVLLIVHVLFLTGSMAFADYGTLTFRADVSGGSVWWGGGEKTLSWNAPFYLDVYANNSGGDRPRVTWSSPFKFTGTGGVTTVIWGDSSLFAQAQFKNFWDVFSMTYGESWDGILPDLFNYTGIGNSGGYPGNLGEIKILSFMVEISGFDSGDDSLCIEQGDPSNDVYDWLFDDPQPAFTMACWPVDVCPCITEGYFTQCPEQLRLYVNQPFSYTFDAHNQMGGGELWFCLPGGPGVIERYTGIWSYTPSISDAWQTKQMIVRAYAPYLSCGNYIACTVSVVIEGPCGDVNKDNLVNILDATDMIKCLYRPIDCSDPEILNRMDINSDGLSNIRDITYLINFLYKGGPAPYCL